MQKYATLSLKERYPGLVPTAVHMVQCGMSLIEFRCPTWLKTSYYIQPNDIYSDGILTFYPSILSSRNAGIMAIRGFYIDVTVRQG